jgi:hypothetical protein
MAMEKTLSFIIGLTLISLTAFGQNSTKKEIREAWKTIPTNIEECMNRLDVLFSDTTKKYFGGKEEKAAVGEYNMLQGMPIRNNWKLWKGSVLSKYFNSYKVYHPEDMTYFIFTSYHRKLNHQPIEFEKQLADYFALIERLKANPPKQTDNFKVGDTVLTHRFGSKGIISDLFGKQPGYEIKAVVQAIDTVNQKFQLVVQQIKRTDTKEKEEVNQYDFNKQLITKGTLFWTEVAWWKKPGQIIQLHIE